MKQNLIALIGLGFLVGALPINAQPPGAPPVKLTSTNDYSKIFKDDKERDGYAIGMSSGKNIFDTLKRFGMDADTNALLNGFKDSVAGGSTRINDAQLRELILMLQQEMRSRQQAQQAEQAKLAEEKRKVEDEKRKVEDEKRKVEAEKNKKDGDAFLALKKNEPGVIPLPSGLMYKVIAEGSGDSPKASDTVTVNYKGTLIDGTEFDSSARTGKPATFRVNGVITGWKEALQLMKPGAKWQLFVPSELAYGDHEKPPKIGPGSVLIFEVELLSVEHSSAAAITPPAAPLTSDIIKVPSAEEIKNGAKIETIKAEDIEKERLKEAAKTNK
jgi:FKBP-type peptidyl-prolyl cis-trans isomerase FklB